MVKTSHCQFSEFEVAVSPLSGREVRYNLSTTKIYLDKDCDFRRFAPAIQRLRDYLGSKKARNGGGQAPRKLLLRAFESLSESGSLAEFADGVDRLIDAGRSLEAERGQKGHVLEFLYGAWGDGLLAMPIEPIFGSKIALRSGQMYLGDATKLCDGLVAGSRRNRENQVIGSFLRLAGPTMGLKTAGDVHPATLAPASLALHRQKHLALVIDGLSVLHRAEYGDRMPSRHDWGLGRKQVKGLEHDFAWVLEEDGAMAEWRSKIREWMNARKRGLASRTYMANRFFAYMLEHPDLPRSIASYCRRDTVLSMTWTTWACQQPWSTGSYKQYTNLLGDFVDWYLEIFLTADDDFGRPVRSPLHWNPISKIDASNGGHKANTHRDALPMRYLHELQRIIVEDDFRWPKTLRTDWFRRLDPETGQTQDMWSPVRAYAILIKLHLPLRTFQVRMLDSGEADSESFVDGKWVKNYGPLASRGKKSVRKGFLRKLRDHQSGAEITGFYVNTNKTADRYKEASDKGYEIPWENHEVISHVTQLRDWQSQFNTLSEPTRWEDVNDKGILRSNTTEMLRERGTACFLFRDVCGVHPAEPVRDSRLQGFWGMLLTELQRRVAERGETMPDGSPLRFAEPQKSTNFPRGLFDLHTLRVSLITALAVDGGVPLHILSKCVAGHATILMTLYYTKPGPAHVSESLAVAQHKLQRVEQKNFVRFLHNAEISQAKPIVAFNDMASLEAIEQCEPTGWAIGETGICPVAGSRCHEGGPALSNGQHVPVPGGPRNCVRCRFFITGPAFLGGLVSKFNAIGFRVSEHSAQIKAAEQQIAEIEDRPVTFEQGDIASAYDHRDSILERIDTLAHDWHACYALIQRSKEILKAGSGSGVDLVLVGGTSDIEVASRECTSFDLVDRICQSATVYPGEEVPLASVRRARLIDAMLRRNGREVLFASLSDQELVSVGNAFVSLLATRLNVGDMNGLIAGQKTLMDCGLHESVDALLKCQKMKPHDGAVLMAAIRKQIGNEPSHG